MLIDFAFHEENWGMLSELRHGFCVVSSNYADFFSVVGLAVNKSNSNCFSHSH